MKSLISNPSKGKTKTYANQNPLETARDIAKEVKTSFVDDLGKGGITEAWDELLGTNVDQASKGHEQRMSDHGELSEGAELDLAVIQAETVQITEMGRAYAQEVIHAGKKANAEHSQETQVRMQEILIEIKKLSESSSELKNQVDVIAIEQSANTPNKYSMNFLEQMLSFVRDMRVGVEDSLAWFKALRSKNASRQYGSMSKKHGTSFTLSGERQVATQVG